MGEKIIIPHIRFPSVPVLGKSNPNNEKKKKFNLEKRKKKRKEASFGKGLIKKDAPSKDLKSEDGVQLTNKARGHIDIKV